MVRAVIDTNVFVSGIFWKGPPYQVLQAWAKGRFKLVVTAEILTEYERILEELGMKYGARDFTKIMDLVRLYGDVVNPIHFAKPVCRDHDDDKFLTAAVSGKAAFLVSGDKDLLVLDGFRGVKIIKPKQFISELY